MAITVTNSAAAYLGQISVSTVSTAFDCQGGDTLVVAVGWSDSADGTPVVSYGGQAMAALTSPAPVDANKCKTLLFILANPPAGSQPLAVGATSFIGNTQFNAVALKGGSGKVGQAGSAVASGTVAPVTLAGTAATSLVLGFAMSFWLGADQTLNADTGYTNLATAYGSNSAGNGFTAAFQIAGGAASQAFTVTPASGAYPTYMAVAVEILASAVVSYPVPVTASTAAYLGQVAAGGSWSTSFDAKGGTLLLVAVSYTDGASALPQVTFNGVLLRPLLNPRPGNSALGTLALFMLAAPASGAQTLALSAPGYLGTTQVSVVAVSGDGGVIGVRTSLIQQASGAATLTLAGTTAGSTLVAFAAADYSQPTTLTPSYGWTQQASATGAGASPASAFVYTSYVSGGTETLVLTPPGYVQVLVAAVEIYKAASVPAATLPVAVTASSVSDLGAIGNGSASVSFDAKGASLLLVAVGWETQTSAPTITYAGQPLTLIPKLTVSNGGVGVMAMAVVPNPPAGAQTLSVTGHAGYYGDTIAALVGLSGASGVAGLVASVEEGGQQLDLSLTGTASTSLLLAFGMSGYAHQAATVAEGWATLGTALGTNANGWLWSAPGGYGAALELLQPAYSTTQVLAVELTAAYTGTAAVTASAAPALPLATLAAQGQWSAQPTPSGQVYHMYLETFFRELDPAGNPQPADFDLAKIPPYCSTVVLFCARPQCAYAGLTSDLYRTMSLNWPANATMTSAQLLQATIALLKQRCPSTKVLLGVQQYTADGLNTNLPYNPQGWAGMTAAHVANMLTFLKDMNMDGVLLDYECLYTTNPESNDTDLANHCRKDPVTGQVTCYTDSEQVAVIKLLRAGIPRPYLLLMYGIHVGAYGQAPYATALPASWNGGYNLCVAKDPVALAALDGIHLGAYDSGDGYDPRVALQAFQHWFPGVPLYLGLRAGPPDGGGIKRTLAELTDYTNHAVLRRAAGVYCYALQWDLDQPSGNISPTWPDATLISTMVAQRLGLPAAHRPLVAPVRGARLLN